MLKILLIRTKSNFKITDRLHSWKRGLFIYHMAIHIHSDELQRGGVLFGPTIYRQLSLLPPRASKSIFQGFCSPRQPRGRSSIDMITGFRANICYFWYVRDESFITSWGGGRLYSGGAGRKFFWWCTVGVENKITYGQGGSCISSGIGGLRCVPLVFLFIKSHSFWGAAPPVPLYPSSIMWDFLNHWATLEIKYALILLNKNLFRQMSPFSFTAFNNNHYHQLHSISRSGSLCLT